MTDGNSAITQRDRSEDFTILFDVDGSAGITILSGTAAAGGNSIGKGDSTEVGKGNESTVRLKVFDDPFSVLTSKGSLE